MMRPLRQIVVLMGVLLPITAETIRAIFRFEPRRDYPSPNEERRAP